MALSIEDQLDIRDLYARWCVAIDDGADRGWADTFTDDAVFALLAPPLRVKGREELLAMAAAVCAHDQGMNPHYCNNIVIDRDGDTATGRCDAVVLELRTGGDARIIKTCRYADRLVRRDGRWLIAERIVTWDTPHVPVQPEVEGATELRDKLLASG
jgi:uncharacterized protein (TIGR02246 family)